jgi:hypothetical protein
MKLLILLIIAAILYGGESVVLDCGFKTLEHIEWTRIFKYRCDVEKSLLIKEANREITEVRGQHENSKNNDDVLIFSTYKKTCNYLPRGITNYFKNIERIVGSYANLQEISKVDLKPFGNKLTRLYLDNNKIKFLENDLFEFNRKLEVVHLQDNEITHIEDGAFKSIYVNWMNLHRNPCTSDDDNIVEEDDEEFYGRSDFYRLVAKVEASCKDPKY